MSEVLTYDRNGAELGIGTLVHVDVSDKMGPIIRAQVEQDGRWRFKVRGVQSLCNLDAVTAVVMTPLESEVYQTFIDHGVSLPYDELQEAIAILRGLFAAEQAEAPEEVMIG